MRSHLRPLIAAAAALALVAGCGGGGGGSLSVDDQATVASFRADVASVALDSSRYGQLLDEIDPVIAIARKDPDAVYQVSESDPKVTMRQVLSDAASELEASDPELADQLDRAVQSLD